MASTLCSEGIVQEFGVEGIEFLDTGRLFELALDEVVVGGALTHNNVYLVR